MFRQVVLCVCLWVSFGAVAAPTTADLKRIEQQLQQERKAGLEAQKKASAITSEMKAVQKQIIGSAKNVQEKEEHLTTLEDKLSELKKRQKELEKSLSLNESQIAQMAMGLETLALRPKELLFLHPMAPINMVRSRGLMDNSLPVLNVINEKNRTELEELLTLQTKIASQAKEVKTAAHDLSVKQAQMERLLKEKQALQARYRATHEQAKKRATALAGQAKDLKDLLKRLEAEKAKQRAEKLKREQAQKARLAATQKMGAQNTPPPVPKGEAAGAFRKSYGSLIWPVKGRIAKHFGDTTLSGAHIKGITLTPRAGAQVVAPFDGTVLFAGPFKSYGHLLIIDHGNNYLSLLAGMSRSVVPVGQDVAAGEAVGFMKDQNPSLYIEIRQNGTPINPEPWFPRI